MSGQASAPGLAVNTIDRCRAPGCDRQASKGTGARRSDEPPITGLCVPHAREARRGARFTALGDQRSGRRGPRRRKPVDPGDGTARVPLLGRRSGQKFALVDIEDLPTVAPLRWEHEPRERTAYARCVTRGEHYGVRLHQVPMGPAPEPDLSVDHINGDGLDNRRSNLRWATPAQQASNRRGPTSSKARSAPVGRSVAAQGPSWPSGSKRRK